MEQEYWVQRDGQAAGPFSARQLKQMAAAGMIMEADRISEDQVNWQEAGQVQGIFQTEQPVPTGTRAEDPAMEASASRGGEWTDQTSPSAPRPEGNCCPRPSSAATPHGEDAMKPAAEPSQVSPAVPARIRPTAKRHYVCPRCGQPFDAVALGTKRCPDRVPRFRATLLTGAEKTRCPACDEKVTFPFRRPFRITVLSIFNLILGCLTLFLLLLLCFASSGGGPLDLLVFGVEAAALVSQVISGLGCLERKDFDRRTGYKAGMIYGVLLPVGLAIEVITFYLSQPLRELSDPSPEFLPSPEAVACVVLLMLVYPIVNMLILNTRTARRYFWGDAPDHA